LLEIGVGIDGLGEIRAMPGEIRHVAVIERIAQRRLADATIGITLVVERKSALYEIVVILLIAGVRAKELLSGKPGRLMMLVLLTRTWTARESGMGSSQRRKRRCPGFVMGHIGN